jgi:hypothetical protein
MGGKILTDSHTALVDLALVRSTTQLELQSDGLLPSHAIMLCELLCWREKTRDLPRETQLAIYKNKLEPILSHLQLSRQNYAQSGGSFCQVLVRGDKLTMCDDRSLVSHKYNNEKTVDIFKTRLGSETLSRHPRRSRGPVYMATHDLVKFRERMKRNGMDLPRDDEL